METMNEKLTAEQNLNLIRKTIEESRLEITRGMWRGLLLWGLSVTVIALVVGHLWQNTSMGPRANGFWGLLGLVAIVENLANKNRPRLPQTFVSKTILQVWSSFGITAGCIGFILGVFMCFCQNLSISTSSCGALGANAYIPITAIIIMSMGVAGMITGKVLASKAITICSFITGTVGSVFAVFLIGPMEMVVMAAASLVGLVVPGIIIKLREA